MIADHNSDGVYDRVYFSYNDSDFSDGNLNDDWVYIENDEKFTNPNEVITIGKEMRIGVITRYLVEYDNNPCHDKSDVRLIDTISCKVTPNMWIAKAKGIDKLTLKFRIYVHPAPINTKILVNISAI